jgi:hypothetical protein
MWFSSLPLPPSTVKSIEVLRHLRKLVVPRILYNEYNIRPDHSSSVVFSHNAATGIQINTDKETGLCG